MAVETINTCTGKTCIGGWFVGLAYHNWFAVLPSHAPVWVHALLVSAGALGASIIIGGSLTLAASALTKGITGRWDGSTDFYASTVLLAPVLAFFAAAQALRLLTS